jgi:DDE superfamily endonuclease
MELILRIYLLPYNALRPVLCFDERPCFLIGEQVEGLEMKAQKPQKEHYAYTKNGSCCVLAAIEPKTGQRLAHIRRQRTKKEFTCFMQNLANNYPEAEKIVVILDNLNTHSANAFYEVLPAEEAEKLAKRFEFIYTPKSASWLNMIEIEFSALSRQCLNRRIPTINQLAKQVMHYFKERMDKKITINWQFSCENARQKLNSHYSKVNPKNQKYKKTF